MNIITGPSCCRNMDPDITLSNNSDPDVTMALVAAQATQITMALVAAKPPDTIMVTGCDLDHRHCMVFDGSMVYWTST
ncbi:hypothetical protein STEG23_021967 [Scotinomys teguina]